MPDTRGGAGAGEVRTAVGRAVVGEGGPDRHAPLGVPGQRALPEVDGRLSTLVGEHFAVGQASVVVDGRVDEGVADAAVPTVPISPPSAHPPPTPGGDASKLLDVH